MTVADPPVPAVSQDDLACPLCAYNLRGLETPRCPECGYAFDWGELRAAVRDTHPFLFEHHPEANVWSFFATLWRGLRPVRFWTSVQAAHAIRTRRLVFYAAALLFCLSIAAAATIYWARPSGGRNATSWVLWYLAPDRPWEWRQNFPLQVAACCAVWPILSAISLLVFAETMRRANVRQAHLWRCVIYSADIVLLPVTALLLVYTLGFLFWPDSLATILYWLRGDPYGVLYWATGLSPQSAIAVVVFFAMMAAKLGVAYRRYLRFPDAIKTVMLSQVVVALALLALLGVVRTF